MQDPNHQGEPACWETGVQGNLLDFLLNFSVNLEMLQKNRVCSLKKDGGKKSAEDLPLDLADCFIS